MQTISSIFLYLLPVLILGLSFGNPHIRRITTISAGSIAICTLGFRYNIGYDYNSYIRHFESQRAQVEPLSNFIFTLAHTLGSANYLFLIYAFIAIAPVTILAYTRGAPTILISYLCLPWFYIEAYSTVRQAAALSVCFLLYDSFKQNRRDFWILLLVPFCLHFSSAPFILLLAILRLFPQSLPLATLTSLAIPILIPLAMPFIHTLYPNTLFYDGSNTYGFKQFVLVTILAILVLNRESLKKHSLLILIGIIFQIGLMQIDSVLVRGAHYFFIPFCFIAWNTVFYKVRIERTAIFALMLCIFLYSLSIKSNQKEGPFIPYQSIFQK